MLKYDELKKLCESYTSVTEDFEPFLVKFLLENAKWTLSQTIDRTPVDTGNLRRNWHITKVYRLPSGNLGFVLMNDADYASYVENGHTTRNRKGWVEGYYMATIAITKLEQRLPRRFDYALSKFLTKHGVL